MMYNYLSLPLAIGVILFDTTFGVSLEVPVNKNFQKIALESSVLVAARETTEIYPTTANAQKSNYLGLMNAGYVANQKKDYLMALNYFQQALKIEPGDSKAIKAISTITTSGFDLYMQSGYAADKIRDYTTALHSFQKALQIKPDSWYAKQAVINVTGYLAQQPVNPPSKTESKGNGFSLWLMLIGIGAASILSAGLLFYLFKKTGSTLEEPEIPDLESSESFESLSESENLSSTEAVSDSSEDSEAREMTTNLNSQSKNSQTPNNLKAATSSTTEPRINSSLMSSTQSLAKLDIVPELIQDLTKSDRSIRRKAVWELAQRGDSRAMKHLVELMMEVDSQERGLILEAMTQIAGRTLKPMNKALMMSLQDDNSQVKQNAIRDLTRVYDLMSQVTKRLSQAVEDSDSQVQETAKWALKKLNQIPPSSNPNWKTTKSTNEVQNMKQHMPQNNSNGTNGTHGNSRSPEERFPLG